MNRVANIKENCWK